MKNNQKRTEQLARPPLSGGLAAGQGIKWHKHVPWGGTCPVIAKFIGYRGQMSARIIAEGKSRTVRAYSVEAANRDIDTK